MQNYPPEQQIAAQSSDAKGQCSDTGGTSSCAEGQRSNVNITGFDTQGQTPPVHTQ